MAIEYVAADLGEATVGLAYSIAGAAIDVLMSSRKRRQMNETNIAYS
ncbi:hypothetical protein [Bombella apis]|uniref:Uncharacterized protein n=1 Tax=Bombella apis TaxID=1785988 RepID=A0ABR9MRV4_9PROT|nr:hypothetical protein [Bombella apis]MBE1723975.1 hypothetical protein [Bombella apis]MBR9730314.1 hypothetical protein [Bombella apis]